MKLSELSLMWPTYHLLLVLGEIQALWQSECTGWTGNVELEYSIMLKLWEKFLQLH